MLSHDKKEYECSSCGRGGDALDFIRNRYQQDGPDTKPYISCPKCGGKKIKAISFAHPSIESVLADITASVVNEGRHRTDPAVFHNSQ